MIFRYEESIFHTVGVRACPALASTCEQSIKARGRGKPAPLLLLLFLCFLASCGQMTGGQTSNSQGNTATLARPPAAPITYVAIGASDTFGIGTGDPYNENWAADLAQKLGSAYHLINLGIPGITVHDALSEELPVALDEHPRLVTIWLAVNDLANGVDVGSYSHDLATMIRRLQASSPRVTIAMANVPDLTLLPYFSAYNPSYLESRVHAYNTAIANIAQQQRVILVNLVNYDLKDFPEYISNDGLHPSTIGYVRIAELFYNALQASLELPKHP
ncbi:MAG TPA: GDSL-type esterase/lipase family protein [Ktedonobacteraceae bacterium]|nr:GDSL-type esterase/lipase family protein [Ktedonobacteraceae bacterium]